MILTPWFPGDVKPVRPGVYMQWCGFELDVGYQHWNGEFWGFWCSTVEAASQYKNTRASTQDEPWRGLMEEPK
jgi:hypothetical protein